MTAFPTQDSTFLERKWNLELRAPLSFLRLGFGISCERDFIRRLFWRLGFGVARVGPGYVL